MWHWVLYDPHSSFIFKRALANIITAFEYYNIHKGFRLIIQVNAMARMHWSHSNWLEALLTLAWNFRGLKWPCNQNEVLHNCKQSFIGLMACQKYKTFLGLPIQGLFLWWKRGLGSPPNCPSSHKSAQDRLPACYHKFAVVREVAHDTSYVQGLVQSLFLGKNKYFHVNKGSD
jgi:hypothetical protein